MPILPSSLEQCMFLWTINVAWTGAGVGDNWTDNKCGGDGNSDEDTSCTCTECMRSSHSRTISGMYAKPQS